MVSFRADEDDVARADDLAERLGIERSELLREALASHVARLLAEYDAEAYRAAPFTDAEVSIERAADWGPAEDWSDWAAWVEDRDHA